MKKVLLLIALSCAIAQTVQAQANHWLFPPDLRMDANVGGSSGFWQFPSTPDILSCTNRNQRVGIHSTPMGSVKMFNECGIYNFLGNLTPPSPSPGVGDDDMMMFQIPAVCSLYYTANWEPEGNDWKFMIRSYDFNGTFTHVADYLQHAEPAALAMRMNYAVGALDEFGNRKVFFTVDDKLYTVDIDAYGNISLASGYVAIPYTLNHHVRMEVTPKGNYLLMYGSQSSTKMLFRYNIQSNTFTDIKDISDYDVSGTAFHLTGFEYVPGPVIGVGQNPRIYYSYHDLLSQDGGVDYIDFTASFPPTPVAAIVTAHPEAFSSTEIELAKDGLLYLAYNPDYAVSPYVPTIGSAPGELFSIDPSVAPTAPTAITYSSAPVPVNCVGDAWAFVIQNQIDGEDYNRECFEEDCTADFVYEYNTNQVPGPKNIDFTPDLPTQHTYRWKFSDNPIPTYVGTPGTYSRSFNPGGYNIKLEILSHPWDKICKVIASACFNEPAKDKGHLIGGPCTSSDFIIRGSTNDPYRIGVSPVSGTEPFYEIDWQDGPPVSSSLPVSFVHTYPGPGTYTICLTTGGDYMGCKTCVEICIPEMMYDFYEWPAEEKGGTTTKVKDTKNTVAEELQLLSVLPNPASTDVTVNINAVTNEPVAILLTDMTGKVVLKRAFTLQAGKNSFKLPLENLSNGMYLLNVNSETQSLKSKIVKQ